VTKENLDRTSLEALSIEELMLQARSLEEEVENLGYPELDTSNHQTSQEIFRRLGLLHKELKRRYPNQELIDALNSNDTERAVELAKSFCKHLKVSYSLWPGVSPHPDRGEQIQKGKRLLAGFPDDVIRLDEKRWNEFRIRLINSQYRVFPRWCEIVEDIIHGVTLYPNDDWAPAASVELHALFEYLNSLHNFDDVSVLNKLPSLITEERISISVAEFLTQHVGHGYVKVTKGSITGFDGRTKMCPISHSRGVGMRYFAIATAEYLLMNIIGAKDILNPNKYKK
jgi:hypothetical protein